MALFPSATAVTTTPGKSMDNSSGASTGDAVVTRAKWIVGGLFILLVILHSRKAE